MASIQISKEEMLKELSVDKTETAKSKEKK